MWDCSKRLLLHHRKDAGVIGPLGIKPNDSQEMHWTCHVRKQRCLLRGDLVVSGVPNHAGEVITDSMRDSGWGWVAGTICSFAENPAGYYCNWNKTANKQIPALTKDQTLENFKNIRLMKKEIGNKLQASANMIPVNGTFASLGSTVHGNH